MNRLNTTCSYATLELKNPVIVASSGLTSTFEKVKMLENAGAAAVVLKSIFEEQIMMEVSHWNEEQTYSYPETFDFLKNFLSSKNIEKYLTLISECKKNCEIPIIASINCYTSGNWVEYAKRIEQAGADALELNMMFVNTQKYNNPGEKEQQIINIASLVKKSINIPTTVKLGNQYTDPISLLNQLQHNNIDGVVLFNRSYSSDINIREMKFVPGPILGNAESFFETLRWTGIASGLLPNLSIAASSGIQSYEAIIKAILCGASAVEICTLIYKEGPHVITHLLNRICDWMFLNGFSQITQFKGKMSFTATQDPNFYERTQFMKYFSNPTQSI